MTQKIRDQILAVRDDGGSNMFDVNGVQRIAYNLNLFDLVLWLEDKANHKEYVRFIMTGEAEITDNAEEDVEEDEDNKEPQPSREEQKKEAIFRMKLLRLKDSIIDDFDQHDKIYLFAGLDGAPVELSPEMTAEVKQFEQKHHVTVFAIIRQNTYIGVLDSLIIVSSYPEEWEDERADIENDGGYLLTYTFNRNYPECSEFGSISFKKTKHGLVRVG